MKTLSLFLIGFTTLIVMAEPDLDDPKTLNRIFDEAQPIEKTIDRDDKLYTVNSTTPYTGWIKKTYDNGQKKGLTQYKDGMWEGLSISWYESGLRQQIFHFKDGKLDGWSMSWYENGKNKEERHFKKGDMHGLYTQWHENGQKRVEMNYKDGKPYGQTTQWNSDGNIRLQSYRDENSKRTTFYYSNGQKKSEYNRDEGYSIEWDETGKITSERYWSPTRKRLSKERLTAKESQNLAVNKEETDQPSDKSMADLGLPMSSKIMTSEGELVTLNSIIGDDKAVLLEFWASRVGPSMSTMDDLKEMAVELGKKGVVVAGINIEADQAIAESVRKDKKITMPWLVEPDTPPYRNALKIDTIPRAVLIDSEGRILFNGLKSDKSLDAAIQSINGD